MTEGRCQHLSVTRGQEIGGSPHLLTLQHEPLLAIASIYLCLDWQASSRKMMDSTSSGHLDSLWLEAKTAFPDVLQDLCLSILPYHFPQLM